MTNRRRDVDCLLFPYHSVLFVSPPLHLSLSTLFCCHCAPCAIIDNEIVLQIKGSNSALPISTTATTTAAATIIPNNHGKCYRVYFTCSIHCALISVRRSTNTYYYYYYLPMCWTMVVHGLHVVGDTNRPTSVNEFGACRRCYPIEMGLYDAEKQNGNTLASTVRRT